MDDFSPETCLRYIVWSSGGRADRDPLVVAGFLMRREAIEYAGVENARWDTPGIVRVVDKETGKTVSEIGATP